MRVMTPCIFSFYWPGSPSFPASERICRATAPLCPQPCRDWTDFLTLRVRHVRLDQHLIPEQEEMIGLGQRLEGSQLDRKMYDRVGAGPDHSPY